MSPLTLVFDLDGTLVDTAPDLVRAANHVLGREGLAPSPYAPLRAQVSFGARRMIETALAMHGHTRQPDVLDRLLTDFLDHYRENIAVESRPFPGVVDLLEAHRKEGVKLAVCTNKPEELSVLLLDALGLSRLFAAIAGRDTFPVCKPHPDHVHGAIRAAGGNPTRAVFVGDSDTDVKAARAAGLPVIGVSFGYTDVPIRDLGPDAVIDHYDEFPAALGRILAARR